MKFIVLYFCFFFIAEVGLSEKVIVKDVLNQDVFLPDVENSVLIFVFARNPSCHDCFLRLEKKLKSLRQNDTTIKVFVIINTQNNAISRKLDRNHFKEVITVDSVFFDNIENYVSTDTAKRQSLFKKFDVLATPAVLIT